MCMNFLGVFTMKKTKKKVLALIKVFMMTAVCILPLLFVSPLHAEETDEIRILQKEAEKGLAEAQNKLAGLYYEGKGVRQNYETAAYWYRKAAKQGHILAQNNLADMFAEGRA